MASTGGSYFPNRFASDKEKETDKYGLNYAKAIYNQYVNKSYSLYNQRERFINNRKYAQGLQSIQKYKDMLNMNGDLSYANLDYSVISVLPKFVDLLVGEMMNQEYHITVDAIDDQSATKFEEDKNKIFANVLLQDFDKMVQPQTGMTALDKSVPVLEDEEEAKMYIQMTYKQAVEEATEEVLNYIFKANKDKELARLIIRDLIILKWCAVRIYYDDNYDIKFRYVDPLNLVVPYSKNDTFDDIDYAGEIVQMSFADIKRMNQTLTDDQLKDIVKKFGYKKQVDRADMANDYGSYYNNGYNSDLDFDDFYIDVLDFEFRSVSDLTYEKKYYKKDGYYMNRRNKDYDAEGKSKKDKKKREMLSKDYVCYYEGFYIVGTEYVFNYGKRKNQPRKKNGISYDSETMSRYKISAPDIKDMENKSLVERMIPHVDQMQIAHLKLQQAIAKSRPAGLSIDVSGLENVMKGKGNDWMKPLEVIEIFDQTGNIIHRGTDPDGNQVNRSPVVPLDNGLPRTFGGFIDVYNFHLNMIRDVTGINEYRDGTTPDAKTLKGVMQESITVSRNTTRPLNEAYFDMLTRLADHTVLMVQLKAEFDPNGLKVYNNAIGKKTVDVLSINKDIANAAFGVFVRVLPSQEERQRVELEIERALSQGNVDLEDAFEVRDLAKTNVKKAIYFLANRRKKKLAEENQRQMALSQANAQAQSQAAMTSKQLDMQLEQMKHQNKLKEIELKGTLDIEKEKVKGMVDAELAMVEGDEKLEQIKASHKYDLDESTGTKQVPEPRI